MTISDRFMLLKNEFDMFKSITEIQGYIQQFRKFPLTCKHKIISQKFLIVKRIIANIETKHREIFILLKHPNFNNDHESINWKDSEPGKALAILG